MTTSHKCPPEVEIDLPTDVEVPALAEGVATAEDYYKEKVAAVRLKARNLRGRIAPDQEDDAEASRHCVCCGLLFASV